LISLELDDFVAGLVPTEDALLLDGGDMEGVLRDGDEQCGVCWKRL